MTDQEIARRYDLYLNTGQNTQEKHIRYMAERIVGDFEGGFRTGSPNRVVWVPWRRPTNQSIRCIFNENDALPPPNKSGRINISVYVPEGMHGFALQLVIEDQLREAILER